ncbi:riboflavin synthase [Albimonas pacifica]|uniref:Riboflavin synthase n=1 Tax=Albimonas pacifica TaxID=1114924 RepID=A0A1I3PC89_9RHOB|nr:riboflavin synthase [Albimonas pacifica]SFJ19148.1 riboflavin synthase alpha chain [Albimonas pacifica]
MFTGIVTDIGEIGSLEKRGDLQARILCSPATARAELGASIACDGVCLTVVASGESEDGRGWFEVDVSAETVSKTTLASWAPGTRINLERALKVGDELGGHIVTGHVDGPAEILSMTDEGDSTRVLFRAPDALARFIASKGSVCLNGTSLTVNEVEGATFGVNLIPHTKTVTTWGDRKAGDRVNLEIDTLARYVARLAETSQL